MGDIKGIIFDMDGVLIDTEKISYKFWIEAFEKFGYEYTMDTHLSILGRNVVSIRNVLRDVFGDDFPLEDILKHRSDGILKHLDEQGTPIKLGVHELLDFLQENNYKIAVATSTSRVRATERLESIGIYRRFDAMICGDEVENSKPNPEIFLKAVNKLGLSPSECIVIEDSPAGVEAGYNGGMGVINVPDMKEADEKIRKQSIDVCENLLEVIDYLKKYN